MCAWMLKCKCMPYTYMQAHTHGETRTGQCNRALSTLMWPSVFVYNNQLFIDLNHSNKTIKQ